jgi:hypothetical protein
MPRSSSLGRIRLNACEEFEEPDGNEITPLACIGGRHHVAQLWLIPPLVIAQQYVDEIDYSHVRSGCVLETHPQSMRKMDPLCIRPIDGRVPLVALQKSPFQGPWEVDPKLLAQLEVGRSAATRKCHLLPVLRSWFFSNKQVYQTRLWP